MAIRSQLKLLLLAGSLVTASLASSVERWSDDNDDDTPLPLVIWHGKRATCFAIGRNLIETASSLTILIRPGLGDTYQADGMRQVAALAEQVNPGTFVYPIRIDENAARDRYASFIGNVTEHVAKVCADLAAHPILSTAPAIDAVGFSQGGQFLRAYVERCNKPPVRSLVTFGSQHNGITAFRDCAPTDWICRTAMLILKGDAWSNTVQGKLVPAQYYRDPTQYE